MIWLHNANCYEPERLQTMVAKATAAAEADAPKVANELSRLHHASVSELAILLDWPKNRVAVALLYANAHAIPTKASAKARERFDAEYAETHSTNRPTFRGHRAVWVYGGKA